jgi:hypothetical protein
MTMGFSDALAHRIGCDLLLPRSPFTSKGTAATMI